MYITLKPQKLLLSLALIAIIVVSSFTINSFGNKGSSDQDFLEVSIIMYHGILKDRNYQNKFVISPHTFENDLKYLTDNGYTTIFMSDLIDYVYSDILLPEKPIILTFDDGYYNNYLYAFDLLKKYNCKMVLSPIGKYTDQYSEVEDNHANYSHCTWNQLNEMVSSGLVEVQNHSYNMHSSSSSALGSKIKKCENKEAYKNRFTSDVMKMQQCTIDNLGTTPNTFTYPFGAISDCSIDFIKEMGFKASLDCEEKINKITKDTECLHRLHRFLRHPNSSSEDYFNKVLSK